MVTYAKIKNRKPAKFLRKVGLSQPKFLELVDRVTNHIAAEKAAKPITKRGNKSDLSIEDKVLLNLYYKRHNPTFENLGEVFGISESYACKIYHRMEKILFKVLDMPDWRTLMDPTKTPKIAIDVTEQPIERPQKGQKAFYSGKKKRHTVKVQLIVCLLTLRILCVVCRKGSVHDFRILKESKIAIHKDIEKQVDLGYKGIQKLYANAIIPIKKTKNKPLTPEDKAFNRKLAQERIKIEHVNRSCKIFRIVKETYRGKHKNYGKTWNLVAALVNFRYS